MATLEEAVQSIISWAWEDSNAELSRDAIREALLADGEPYPTEGEAELMLCGDEWGEIPSGYRILWPRLSKYLDGELT